LVLASVLALVLASVLASPALGGVAVSVPSR